MNVPDDSISILIVEDEGLVALDLADLLTDLGYFVCAIARTADQAVEAAGLLRPHLVLSDVHLAQGSSGLDAARRIRGAYGIPCCFVSGSVDAELIAEARDAEPLAILAKPLQARLLREVLAEAFAQPPKTGQRPRALVSASTAGFGVA